VTPSRAPRTCDEKAALLRAYSFAASDYGRAVKVLHEHLGTLLKGEYEKMREFSERAMRTADEARAALARHTAEHGC
jgi:hypothetical protein